MYKVSLSNLFSILFISLLFTSSKSLSKEIKIGNDLIARYRAVIYDIIGSDEYVRLSRGNIDSIDAINYLRFVKIIKEVGFYNCEDIIDSIEPDKPCNIERTLFTHFSPQRTIELIELLRNSHKHNEITTFKNLYRSYITKMVNYGDVDNPVFMLHAFDNPLYDSLALEVAIDFLNYVNTFHYINISIIPNKNINETLMKSNLADYRNFMARLYKMKLTVSCDMFQTVLYAFKRKQMILLAANYTPAFIKQITYFIVISSGFHLAKRKGMNYYSY